MSALKNRSELITLECHMSATTKYLLLETVLPNCFMSCIATEILWYVHSKFFLSLVIHYEII
jgi:hypothetical protein